MPKRKTEPSNKKEVSNKENIVTSQETPSKKSKRATKPTIITQSYPKEISSLKNLLTNAQTSGSYSVSGEATELSSIKSIKIKELGQIKLPINETDAQKLMEVCKQAPYGHNFDTVVNKKVRDTFQLEPSSVEINNQNWQNQLQKLANRVSTELGCKGKVEAKLYKLLLYKKNGHFTKHMDSEKDKTMFGTLVLQLPSVHTGGELVVYNPDGSKTIHDFGKSTKRATIAIHYAAHYADAEHEVLKIKSGYRLALIYSLCWVDGNGISTINDNESITKMREVLHYLQSSMNTVGIMLEHKYTPQSFCQNGVKALKGIDNDRFGLIRNANYHLPADEQFEFNIAHACLVVDFYDITGYEGEGIPNLIWEENERRSEVKEVYRANGDVLVSFEDEEGFNLEAFSVVIDPKIDRVLAKEDFEDWKTFGKDDVEKTKPVYTGNEGVTKKTYYNKYLLIIAPKKFLFDFYLKTNLNLAVSYIRTNSALETNENAIEMYKKILARYDGKNLEEYKLLSVLMKLKEINAVDLLVELLSKISFLPDLCMFQIALILVDYGWDRIYDAIKKHFNSDELHDSLKLVKDLVSLDENIAVTCFETCVLPAFKNKESVEKIKEDLQSLVLTYDFQYKPAHKINKDFLKFAYEIVETLLLFKRNKLNAAHEQISSMFLAVLTPDELSELIRMFKKKIEDFKQSKTAAKLFEARIKWLVEQINEAKQFSWRMDGTISEHPEIEKFLRSNKTAMDYTGISSVGNVKKFIKAHTGLRFKYSLSMDFKGTGSNIVINIKKTKEYHESKLKGVKLFEVELHFLRKIKFK